VRRSSVALDTWPSGTGITGRWSVPNGIPTLEHGNERGLG
jgi:hypothetical protein